MYVERRRAPRVEVMGRIQGHVMSADAAIAVREISLGGLSFSSPAPFPVGSVHQFRLTLGDDSDVMMRGRIVRSELRTGQDGFAVYITGVQFLDDDLEDESPGVGGLIDKMS